MYRYPPKSGSKRGFPLLDTTSLEYLFSQVVLGFFFNGMLLHS